MFPRPVFATPIVAGAPFAVFGGAVDALAPLLLLPPPPQPATASAVSGTTAAPARKVMDLLRVMLRPLVADSHVRRGGRGCRRAEGDSLRYRVRGARLVAYAGCGRRRRGRRPGRSALG